MTPPHARPRRLPALLLALAALLAPLALPAGAGAASPKAFLGVNGDGLDFSTASKLGAGLSVMRSRGVGTVRMAFYWRTAQPYARMSDVPEADRAKYVEAGGRPTNFGPTDVAVGQAAKRGISVLPVVIGSPNWVSTNPSNAFAQPRDAAEYGRFAATLARRYGPGGSFWKANPKLTRRPLRYWQIWNEPAGFLGFGDRTVFWEPPFDTAMRDYTAMLKAARKGIRKVDPKARIVLSGFFGRSWLTMAQLYKAGYRKLFDVVAIHPYAKTVDEVEKIARIVRKVMRKNGDADKPMMLTEFGWTSSLGKLTDDLGLDYITVTESQQASLLRSAFRQFWDDRGKLRLRAAFWYTWATADREKDSPFDYAGLNRRRDDGSIEAKPAARAYGKIARKLR